MDSKKVIEQLIKIAEKQQKIINKIAQEQSQSLQSQTVQKRPADAILQALPPNVKAGVEILEVHGDEVRVKLKKGPNQQATYDGVLKTVTNLQNQNLLPGSSYNVRAV